MSPTEREPRFLTLADVAEILATSVSQVRALVRDGELRAIRIGGRQQYRVETTELEAYIQRMYAEAYPDDPPARPADQTGVQTGDASADLAEGAPGRG